MTANAHEAPLPRSGDAALTPARYVQGAAGWLAFFRRVTQLFEQARAQGRSYLDYGEWNSFFNAALRHGCVTREEISGEIVPLRDKSAANPRAFKGFGLLAHAMIVETMRQVRDAKARGDSAWNLHNAMNASDLAYYAERAERERAQTSARAERATAQSLDHRRAHRRNRDDDDPATAPPPATELF